MKIYEEMTVEEVVKYIELEMAKGRSCKDIEEKDFGVKERVIRKRLSRKGIKIDTKIYNTSSTTRNNTIETPVTKKVKEKGIIQVVPQVITPVFDDVEMNKIKYYIDNFEVIKSLVDGSVPKEIINNNSIEINSKETTTTSLRINKEIYELIKVRSQRDNVGIGEIMNRALLDYLKNYL
ncbi:MAG: hypothetical protein RSF39_10295 [Romboutsia sp.]